MNPAKVTEQRGHHPENSPIRATQFWSSKSHSGKMGMLLLSFVQCVLDYLQ